MPERVKYWQKRKLDERLTPIESNLDAYLSHWRKPGTLKDLFESWSSLGILA